jgi:hypothetical protein
LPEREGSSVQREIEKGARPAATKDTEWKKNPCGICVIVNTLKLWSSNPTCNGLQGVGAEMIPRFWRCALSLTLSAWSAACAVQNVADPARISLEQAMVDTVDALNAANRRSKHLHTDYKFYRCSVTAVYNISATATVDNKVGLTATGPTPPVVPIAYAGSISSEAQASGTRGNTVTVVLETPYCMQNKVLPAGAELSPNLGDGRVQAAAI